MYANNGFGLAHPLHAGMGMALALPTRVRTRVGSFGVGIEMLDPKWFFEFSSQMKCQANITGKERTRQKNKY